MLFQQNDFCHILELGFSETCCTRFSSEYFKNVHLDQIPFSYFKKITDMNYKYLGGLN